MRRAADWLQRFVGARVGRVMIGLGGRLDNRWHEEFGRVVTAARSHGKLLWLEFDDGRALRIKFQLKGYLAVNPHGDIARNLGIVEFAPAAPGGDPPRLVLRDPTRFARLTLTTAEAMRAEAAALGPDPFAREITAADFAALDPGAPGAARRRTPLASALLNQKLVAGVGNYMRAEIVHAAGLAPAEWRAPHAPAAVRERLARATNELFRAVYEAGAGGYRMRCFRAPGAREEKLGSRAFFFRA